MTRRLTIEELAAATGQTVRNIREHQTRGLLPPPLLQGRKGSYDERHVARLNFIAELQSQGLNLQAIHWLLERAPADAAEEVVRFERALFAPWVNDSSARWTTAELEQRVGPFDPDLMRRAIELDLIRPAGAETWEIVSTRLLEAGADLLEMGIPLEAALEVVTELKEHTAAAARTFVRLFVAHVWEPFDAKGRPADQWEFVGRALERLRPIATQALLAVFAQSMEATVHEATVAAGLDVPRQESA